jgi:hypothetical protein
MQVNKAENKNKVSVVFHIFAVLLLATLLSCRMMGGTMAKYVSTDSKSDSARVAKFSVTANGVNEADLSLKYGESTSYTLSVDNASEVAVSFKVSITFENCDVSDKLSVALNKNATSDHPAGSPNTQTGVYDAVSGNTVFTFTDDGSYCLNAGGSADYTITVTALNGFLPGENNKVESQSTSFDFETMVEFVQID